MPKCHFFLTTSPPPTEEWQLIVVVPSGHELLGNSCHGLLNITSPVAIPQLVSCVAEPVLNKMLTGMGRVFASRTWWVTLSKLWGSA